MSSRKFKEALKADESKMKAVESDTEVRFLFLTFGWICNDHTHSR